MLLIWLQVDQVVLCKIFQGGRAREGESFYTGTTGNRADRHSFRLEIRTRAKRAGNSCAYMGEFVCGAVLPGLLPDVGKSCASVLLLRSQPLLGSQRPLGNRETA